MPPTIKVLQAAMRRHLDAGLNADELVERIAVEYPDAKDKDTRIASAALAEEETSRQMVLGEALAYLAERGDEEAQARLDQLKNNPERQAFERDFEAAVEWHPDWTKEGRSYRCKPDSKVPTPDTLVEAFRRK